MGKQYKFTAAQEHMNLFFLLFCVLCSDQFERRKQEITNHLKQLEQSYMNTMGDKITLQNKLQNTRGKECENVKRELDLISNKVSNLYILIRMEKSKLNQHLNTAPKR